jgi:hypothetical protein
MDETLAPGLTADWLNAWLAAIGVTVLVPGIRLGWTADPLPVARFDAPLGDVVAGVAGALPSLDDLGHLSIARALPGHAELPRTVGLAAYRERAQVSRERGDLSLGVTVTDLQDPIRPNGLPHSPFDPPVPQGRTLFQRLCDCRLKVGDRAADLVAATFEGHGLRVQGNGLGFDSRRFAAGVQPEAGVMVNPVVECLAFFGLALFPVRGNGFSYRTRGWGKASKEAGFDWVAWSPLLDRWAIDSLLDQLSLAGRDRGRLNRLGILARFESVPFSPVGSADTTRAYASRRVG